MAQGTDGSHVTDAAMADRLTAAYQTARQALLAERTADGFWIGELSSSALATATATSALALVDPGRHAGLIERGMRWLAGNQNSDGGWGDTPDSPSNVATTMLAQAALAIAGAGHTARRGDDAGDCRARAEAWVCRSAGRSHGERVAALRRAYGDDRTFSVPILAGCALAGGVEWQDIPGLPFELALVPHRWLRLLRAHVVSYALPALVAIGQLLHARRPSRLAPLRWIRNASVRPTLRKLRAIQPATGGYIEAVPLTSFVVMSLAAAGRADHPVVTNGAAFLARLARADGSWPIDSNLSVWLTTLSVNALAAGPDPVGDELAATLEWIAAQQHDRVHPFTRAAPGGWGWTHLAGGVPDADDTAGALLALSAPGGQWGLRTAQEGIRWLLALQNRDGGWPTFCRGWGRLPFDRSAPDLTAHALRALAAWRDRVGHRRLDRATARGLYYLAGAQREDGSWLPLWFGNQQAPDGLNPVFGTARVLAAYRDLGMADLAEAKRGAAFLVAAQRADGAWGGDHGVAGSIEETAAAVSALSGWPGLRGARKAVLRGSEYLVERICSGPFDKPSPIGLYFTKLWYSERLYPLIWTVDALGRVLAIASGACARAGMPAASMGGRLP